MTRPAAPARVGLAIQFNGVATTTAASTLAGLLAEQGFADAQVATAINGAFVPARERAATGLESGDCIEIVSARQGG